MEEHADVVKRGKIWSIALAESLKWRRDQVIHKELTPFFVEVPSRKVSFVAFDGSPIKTAAATVYGKYFLSERRSNPA